VHILLVNDDGIASANLELLCRAAAARGHRVTVSAPSVQQSGKSMSFTYFSPVMVHPRQMEGAEAAWAVDGTPTDCSRIGFVELCKDKPDLVISGINDGYNTGLATFLSGTVGAAREAAFNHIRAMAVSMHEDTPAETGRFYADWLITLAERYARYEAPPQAVLNVNAPPVPVYELKPPVMCQLNQIVYDYDYDRRVNPRGVTYFWPERIKEDTPVTPGSDDDLLRRGHITCTLLTPVPCDQAAYADLLEDL